MERPPRGATELDWQEVSREMKRKSVTLLLLRQNSTGLTPTALVALGSATSSARTRSAPRRIIQKVALLSGRISRRRTRTSQQKSRRVPMWVSV